MIAIQIHDNRPPRGNHAPFASPSQEDTCGSVSSVAMEKERQSGIATSKRKNNRPKRDVILQTPAHKTKHFCIASMSSPAPNVPKKPSSTNSIEQIFWKRLTIDDTSGEGCVRSKIPTAYEVDAPREKSTPSCYNRRSITPSTQDLKTLLKRGEEDHWAGINALLESQRLDETSVFSASDILPKDIVERIRNERGSDEREKHSGRSKSSDAKKKRHKKKRKETKRLPSVDETPTRELATPKDRNKTKISERNGNMFDMFVWSDKDNIDELVYNNKKLNKSRKENNKVGFDEGSMPSLASFSTHERGVCSVVTEEICESHGPIRNALSCDALPEDDILNETSHPIASSAANIAALTVSEKDCKLVLDKEVDAHIAKMQLKLSPVRNRKSSVLEPAKEGETSFVDHTSPVEDFESWKPFSNSSANIVIELDRAQQHSNRSKEKKLKQSIPSKFVKSLKRLKIPKTPRPPKTNHGDDGKFFPREERLEAYKAFSSRRGLLDDDDDL